VIKVNQLDLQSRLGGNLSKPTLALAFKFQPKQETTKIHDIIVQVGRTGALTPVAVMEPVKVAVWRSAVRHSTIRMRSIRRMLELAIRLLFRGQGM